MKKILPSVKIIAILLLSAWSLQQANAQALLTENFDYPAGTYLNAAGWKAHSGTAEPVSVVVPGLTFAGYPLSNIGGAASLDNNGEDVNKTFSVQTSGIVYASFMVKVNALADGYFLHLGGDPTSTIFRAKVFTSGTSDPFNFGLSVFSNTATTVAGGSFNKDKTYLFVLKYEIVDGEKNDVVSLFILSAAVPATEPVTPTIGPLTDATQTDIVPGSIALRQFNAAENITIDGIRIAKSWADAVTATAGGDSNPPVFTSGYPKITNIKSKSVDIQVSMDEPGKVFFVVLKDGTPSPTAAEVFSGNTSTGGVAGGSLDVASGGVVSTHTLPNLTDQTFYDAYFIAQDDEVTPNKQVTPMLVEFYTQQPRDTLLLVDFSTSLAPFVPVSIKGDQVWTKTEYSNNGYAYLNGYSSGAVENTDWLISPAISDENAGYICFSFRTAKNYSGPGLKVLISDQFNGSYTSEGINQALWTDITSGFTLSSGSFTWVPSGVYAFGTFQTGKVYVAFVYESTTSGAAAWEIDDFVVTGYKKGTGIFDLNEADIVLYPVPANDELHFRNMEGVISYEVIDMNGKTLKAENWTGATEDKVWINSLERGFYLMRFFKKEGISVKKFIKD